MKTLNFDFGAVTANDKTLREVTKLFERAGVQVVNSEVAKSVIKRQGIATRDVTFTFADSQTVTMSVKESGDVFQVKINGGLVPVREQDDHARAIKEIAALLDRRRAAFQKAMARAKMPTPPIARASRTSVLAALTTKRDGLKEAIGIAEQELAELTAQ